MRELAEHVVVGSRLSALLLTGDDPGAGVAGSARRQAEAFAAAPPEQFVPHPHGDLPAAAFLRLRLVDLVVHAGDLLRGAHLDKRLDPLVVDQLLSLVEPHLEEMLALGSYGEGPRGTLPPGAPAQAGSLIGTDERPGW